MNIPIIAFPPQSGDMFIEKELQHNCFPSHRDDMFIGNDYPHEKVRPRRDHILVWSFVVCYKYYTPTEWLIVL